MLTNERGMQVFKNNSHISKLIEQKTDSIANHLLGDHIEWVRKKNKCDRKIDFCESIEVSLSQHPKGQDYKLSKPERFARFNRNFYEFTMEWAKLEWKNENLLPELFFDDSELEQARKYLKPDSYNILVGMSGSNSNKCWPWTQDFCENLCNIYPNIHIITVGDERCKLIEPLVEGRITNLSGDISMRQSMALTSMVNLVISPDTGLLHASGCYETPKLGLLGHNTIECITKHFKNDHSIESNPELAECSPCFLMIYNMKLQCPLNDLTLSSVCMSDGISLEHVMTRFKEIYGS